MAVYRRPDGSCMPLYSGATINDMRDSMDRPMIASKYEEEYYRNLATPRGIITNRKAVPSMDQQALNEVTIQLDEIDRKTRMEIAMQNKIMDDLQATSKRVKQLTKPQTVKQARATLLKFVEENDMLDERDEIERLAQEVAEAEVREENSAPAKAFKPSKEKIPMNVKVLSAVMYLTGFTMIFWVTVEAFS